MIALLVGLLTGSPVSAGRPKRTERIVTVPYTLTSAVNVPGLFAGRCGDESTGCPRVRLKRNERWVSLEVKDVTGLPVYAYAFVVGGDPVGEACGRTEKPFYAFAYEIEIYISTGVCYGTTTPSIPTTGEVVVTLSNRP
jgi:hypothetical protein